MFKRKKNMNLKNIEIKVFNITEPFECEKLETTKHFFEIVQKNFLEKLFKISFKNVEKLAWEEE